MILGLSVLNPITTGRQLPSALHEAEKILEKPDSLRRLGLSGHMTKGCEQGGKDLAPDQCIPG